MFTYSMTTLPLVLSPRIILYFAEKFFEGYCTVIVLEFLANFVGKRARNGQEIEKHTFILYKCVLKLHPYPGLDYSFSHKRLNRCTPLYLVYPSHKGGGGRRYISICFPMLRRLFPVTIPAKIRISILRTIQKVIRVTLTILDL
jgi:hypothetical protein